MAATAEKVIRVILQDMAEQEVDEAQVSAVLHGAAVALGYVVARRVVEERHEATLKFLQVMTSTSCQGWTLVEAAISGQLRKPGP